MSQIMYPGNSNKEKEQKPEKKTLEKVTDGKVIKRKKSLGKRFLETFISEDIHDVKQYLIEDVLIPSAKEMILDGMEMMLLGRTTRNRSKNNYGKVTNYNSISKGDRRDRNRNQARMSFDDVYFESRAEAEEVLSRMVDTIEEYQVVTVADMYDLAGVTSSFTDHKWGWSNLASASVSRVREGYILNLPKASYID